MNKVFKIDHPLCKEINTNDFDVKINDDKTKLTITNNGKSEEYDVRIDKNERVSSKPFKYISVKEGDSEIIFKIIENNDQIKEIKLNYFLRWIFLEKFEPSKTSIDLKKGVPSFEQSIFKGGCNFTENYSDKKEINGADLKNCIFLGDAQFHLLIFKNEVKSTFPYTTFSGSAFLDEADFMCATFEADALFENCVFKSANFKGAKFKNDADFKNCIFKDVSFSGVEFEQYTSFKNSRFLESLNLSNSKINKMNLADAKIKKLHLTDVEIKDDINCENTEIKEANRRETFTTLKENCIKKYDNISALYFHKKEMKQYSKDLNKKFFNKFTKYNLILNSIRNFFSSLYKNKFIKHNPKLNSIRNFFSLIYKYILGIIRIIFSLIYKFILEIIRIIEFFFDKFILFFEKIVSNYGTNPFLAIFWFFILHYIDYVIRDRYDYPCNESDVKDFNIYKLNIIEFMESGLGIWFLIKIILSSVLIFEIIKSFRKFSRKL